MSSRTFRVWAPRADSLALRIRGEDGGVSSLAQRAYHVLCGEAVILHD